MPRAAHTWDSLPWFASDEAIGEAALGRERRGEFHGLATLHERDGMPRINPVWGGRYVPAVKAFFDAQYGLTAVPLAPNGIEGSFHEKPRLKVATEKERAAGAVLVRRS
jgi:hypothetical protein